LSPFEKGGIRGISKVGRRAEKDIIWGVGIRGD
jgi:hypothetical protein